MLLAPLDRRSEDVRVVPVVIAEFKLSDVQMQVLFADLMKGADHATLDQRPEALDRVGMDRADNTLSDVFPFTVIDGFVREAIAQAPVAEKIIGAKQADLGRDGLIDEALKRAGGHVADNASNHVSLALDRADNGGLLGIATTSDAGFLVPVPIFVAATNVGFVNLDNAAKLFEVFDERASDLVAHQPSGFVGAEAHGSLHLKGRNAFLAGQHHVDNAIPVAERLVGVLKNRSRNVRETIASLWRTLVALPSPAIRELMRVGRAAARAVNPVRPAASYQVGRASLFIREHGLELGNCELVDGFRTFGHGFLPTMEGYCHG
jgi:hypothetical protein